MKAFTEHQFSKNDDFRFYLDKSGRYFINQFGKRVLTDVIGEEIWKALPGTSNEIIDRVRAQMSISNRLIYEFLHVFVSAGMIDILPDPEERRLEEIGALRTNNQAHGSERISVVVVTYNGASYVQRCFDSIRQQSYPHIEIIAVDNASQDSTLDLLHQCFPEVKVLALNKNLHYTGGVNHGLMNSEGEYVLVLNQDTELDPDCVRQLLLKARSNPQAGAITPMMKFSRLRGFINGIGNQITNRSWGTDNFIHCVDVGQFESLNEVPSACFGAVLLRKKTVDKIGMLDRAYGSFYEDTDWSFRCWLQGWKVIPAPKAVVYHEFGASYPAGKKLFFVARNRLRLVLKIFQGRILLGFIKNYLKEDVRNSLSLLRKKDLGSFVCYGRAYFSLIVGLPGIFVKRIILKKNRIKGMREQTILEKNPSFYCCLYPELDMPEIDAGTIRRYYRWHLLDRISSYLSSIDLDSPS